MGGRAAGWDHGGVLPQGWGRLVGKSGRAGTKQESDSPAAPHQLLREVHRVIRPEGQLIIAGFNPFSLFGTKRYFGREQTMPWTGNFIALYRLKDWLSLLGFEVAGGRLDCYVPPFAQEKWLQPFHFSQKACDHCCPTPAVVYLLL